MTKKKLTWFIIVFDYIFFSSLVLKKNFLSGSASHIYSTPFLLLFYEKKNVFFYISKIYKKIYNVCKSDQFQYSTVYHPMSTALVCLSINQAKNKKKCEERMQNKKKHFFINKFKIRIKKVNLYFISDQFFNKDNYVIYYGNLWQSLDWNILSKSRRQIMQCYLVKPVI